MITKNKKAHNKLTIEASSDMIEKYTKRVLSYASKFKKGE